MERIPGWNRSQNQQQKSRVNRQSWALLAAYGLAVGIAPALAEENFPQSRFGAPPSQAIGLDAIRARASAPRFYSATQDENDGVQANVDVENSGRSPASTHRVRVRDADSNLDDEPTLVQRPKGPEAPKLSGRNNSVLEMRSLARRGVQEVSLIAGDLGYFPKTIFVSRDVPVRMYVTGASKNTLCIMLDGFQVRKQVRSQKIEEITFTPNEPGKYRFYCPVNGMEGTLVVKELASDT